jgi:hypothetical protein
MSNPILLADRLRYFLSQLLYLLLFARCCPPNAYHRGRPYESRRPAATPGNELATAAVQRGNRLTGDPASEQAKRLAAHIIEEVKDQGPPELFEPVARKIAYAVVCGNAGQPPFPRRKLDEIIGRTKRQEPLDRGRYFVGAVQRAFAELGIEWERGPPKTGTASR